MVGRVTSSGAQKLTDDEDLQIKLQSQGAEKRTLNLMERTYKRRFWSSPDRLCTMLSVERGNIPVKRMSRASGDLRRT
jgi:hypothetical protein